MKTVILAAGLGTRVQHLYPNIPKVMLPLAGKPLLEHTILRLRSQGFSDLILNLHYFPDVITNYFGDGSKFGVKIQYSYEPELLESAGAIKKMEPMIDSDPFVLVYGDVFWNLDVRSLVSLYQARHAFAVLTAKMTKNITQSDFLEIDPATGRIMNVHMRPHMITASAPNLLANVGLHVWSRRVLDFIPADTKVHLDREITPKIFAAGHALYARPVLENETVMDMGKPDNIKAIESMFAKGSL